MIENNTIWLSNIKYLNDSKEYNLFFSILEEVIKEYPNLSVNYSYRSSLWETNIFSFSLTEKQDDLSQWRGYAANGGYCFSFDKERLNSIIESEKLSVMKCLYKKEEQREFIINTLIGCTPEEYRDKMNDSVFCYSTLPNRIGMSIPVYIPLFKDVSFKEEKEWRIVKTIRYNPYGASSFSSEALNRLKFRSGKNTIVPYYELSTLHEDQKPVGINEVIVGPTPLTDLAIDACNTLLVVNGSPNCARKSDIPYRNW